MSRSRKSAICGYCGISFTYDPTSRQVTCSRSCGQRLRAINTDGRSVRDRICEVCGNDYRATYSEQRTCGRECGKQINARFVAARNRPPKPPPIPKTYQRVCVECGIKFIAKPRMIICGVECYRRRASRRSSLRIMKRYYADPEFRDQVISSAQTRRASNLGAGDIKVTLAYLIKRDKGRCGICHKPVRAKRGPMMASMDHVIPLSMGGTHELTNVQLAHYRCNLMKHNRGGGEQLMLVG